MPALSGIRTDGRHGDAMCVNCVLFFISPFTTFEREIYPQDLGLPGCWLKRGVLHGTPLDFVRSARHLFKQAVCTAYEGHKPLTVSGKVNM